MNSNETYSTFLATHYDILYKDKHNHRKVSKEIINFLKEKYVSKRSSIIDIGCGTGTHASLIAKEGYDVTGIDISPDMIIQALKKTSPSLKLQFHCLSLEKTQQTFDFAYSITNVINCLNSLDNLSLFFKNISQILKPKSFFLFDCWNTETILIDPPKKIKDTATIKNQTINRTIEPFFLKPQNVIFLNYLYSINEQKTSIQHRIKLFSQQEIMEYLNKAGFKIINIYSNILEKNTLTNTSREIFYVVQKQ
jgi:2-polyprenyl-3-methyl-5-hydroxy-6-metoxy-1,4-benzoquinol methylase